MFEELLRGRKERERNVSCVTNTHGLQKKMVSRKQRDEILLRSLRDGGGENQRMFHGKNNGGSEKQTRKERQKESRGSLSEKKETQEQPSTASSSGGKECDGKERIMDHAS